MESLMEVVMGGRTRNILERGQENVISKVSYKICITNEVFFYYQVETIIKNTYMLLVD